MPFLIVSFLLLIDLSIVLSIVLGELVSVSILLTLLECGRGWFVRIDHLLLKGYENWCRCRVDTSGGNLAEPRLTVKHHKSIGNVSLLA